MSISGLYEIISCRCEEGYSLVDERSGLPHIEQSDISESGQNVFTVRFRIPVEKFGILEMVAHRVCKDVKSEMHMFVAERREYGIPYYDAVWIVSPNSAESEK